MNLPTMARALGWSLLVCTLTVALLAGLIQAGQVGGTLQAVFDMTAYFSLTYAAVAVVVLIPAFLLLGRFTTMLERRRTGVLLGAGLAAFSSLVLVVAVFRRPTDPHTLAGWITFWAANAVPFAAGITPFVLGGATFGARWTAPAPPPVDAPLGRHGGRSRVRTPRSTAPRVP